MKTEEEPKDRPSNFPVLNKHNLNFYWWHKLQSSQRRIHGKHKRLWKPQK